MQRVQQTHQRVVLVGQVEWPQFFFMALALRRGGFAVTVVTDIDQPKRLKGFIDFLPVGSLDGQAFQRTMHELADNPEVSWVMPLEEAAIEACHDIPAIHGKLFPHMNDQVRATLRSKSSMGALAQAVGLRVPGWAPAPDWPTTQALASAWGFPVVLKGEQGHAGNTVHICHHEAALRAAWDKLGDQPCFLQQHIQGGNWGCGGFFSAGQPRSLQCYDILVQDPPLRGPATRVRMDPQTALTDGLCAMARELKWTGFLQADFMRDTATGDFYFLELNPRGWGTMTASQGMAAYAPMVAHLLGQSPAPMRPARREQPTWVFPKPVTTHIAQGRTWQGLLGLLRPGFWLSAPTLHWSVLYFFGWSSYWHWHNLRAKARRNTSAQHASAK